MSVKLSLAVAAVLVTSAGTARADEPRGVDWGKVIVDLDHFVRTTNEAPVAAASKPNRTVLDDPSPQNMGSAWFGVAPRVTLVARDWASSTRLAGDRLSLVDGMRLASSTRMVVGRARLSNTRFTPFLQLGVGQWRVDRNYLPHLPQSIEIAGQMGTGFELRLTRRWQLAAELSATALIREHLNETQPQTAFWSTLVASRVEF